DSNGSAIPPGNPPGTPPGITFQGNAGTDKFILTGGNQGSVSYSYLANSAATITNTFGSVFFNQTEQFANTNTGAGTISDIAVNLAASPANTLTFGDDGIATNTLSRLTASTIPQTDFANPTGSLTINSSNTADAVTLNSLPNFNASLVIGAAGAEVNTVTVAGAVALASNNNLSVNALGTISLPNATSTLTTNGSGSVTLVTAKNISLSTGSK